MSGPYTAIYKFEYGALGAPVALELREYEGEPGFSVHRVPPSMSGRALAWFALLDDARMYMETEISTVFRGDRAADEMDRRDGRAE